VNNNNSNNDFNVGLGIYHNDVQTNPRDEIGTSPDNCQFVCPPGSNRHLNLYFSCCTIWFYSPESLSVWVVVSVLEMIQAKANQLLHA
jgi:hypothetical protein